LTDLKKTGLKKTDLKKTGLKKTGRLEKTGLTWQVPDTSD